MTATRLERGDLPLEMLVEMAVREGRRPRPIYQMHKWFARRLPSVVRASLIAAFADGESPWGELYYGPPSLIGKKVLDPFVGGGTTVVEASRLGATVVGCDIDPVACFVTRQELQAKQIPALKESLESLQEAVWPKIKRYYEVDADSAYLALHFFWVQRIKCERCTGSVDAHHTFTLASGDTDWLICPACSEVFETKSGSELALCGCGHAFVRTAGCLEQGVVTCPCGHKTRLIEYGRKTRRKPRWVLCAIEAIPKEAKRHPVPNLDRKFFTPQKGDHQRYRQAAKALKALLKIKPTSLPNEAIPSGPLIKDHRLHDYGYRKWTDIFNARQLLHLALLANEIRDLGGELGQLHALAFSNHLTTNCMMTSYAAGWRRLTPLFSVRGYRHINRPVELNPWLRGTGRGSYPNAVRQIERGRSSTAEPREPRLGGGFEAVLDISAASFAILNGDSSRRLDLGANSVDMVLSDPPYFDNVVYSELSEFFGVWLRFLGCLPGAPVHELVRSRSLISRSRSYHAAQEFVTGLAKAFKKIYRVLKPGGLCAFTYRHSTPDGWLALHNALRSSGLTVVQLVPVPGELGSGLHARPGTNLWDALLVLKKSPRVRRAGKLGRQQMLILEEHVESWSRRLQDEKRIPYNAASRLNLWRAALVAGSLGFHAIPEEALEAVDQLLSSDQGGQL